MRKKFTEFYENGNIKRTGYRNELNNIDGFVILYNEDGTEKEKLKYNNGMRLGNVLIGLSSEEIIQKLIIEGEAIDINEIGENELYDEGDDVSLAKASTLLTDKKKEFKLFSNFNRRVKKKAKFIKKNKKGVVSTYALLGSCKVFNENS